MKILHLLASNRFSGAENVVCQIINMFRDDKDVTMIYCSPDGQIRDALAERGVQYAPIDTLSIKELRRVIKEVQPDLIHAHDMRASFFSALVVGKNPFISHIHGNFAGLNKITPKAMAYAFAALKAKHVFWVSQSSYDNYVFKGVAANKSSVLYNVIDVDSIRKKTFSDRNNYNYEIVFLGRLVWEKNPERLIRVIKLLAEKKPDVRVALVGTGDLDESTKSLAHKLSLDSNIDFLGFKSNPLKILHDSKVMIMTSVREGTPMCALEAMALGVPIVSTPTDGMKDLIIHGKTGFVSNEDTELAAYLYEVITDKALYESLSKNSINESQRINDLNEYKEKLKNVYAGELFK